MASYTNVFGGGTVVTPTNNFYIAINLSSNIQLAWGSNFGNNPLVVATIMDISPQQNGYTVTMPNATNVSVGQSFSINNKTNFSFNLLANDGSTIISTINGPGFYTFYLTNNTSRNGSWTLIPFSGVSAITSIGINTGNTSGNIIVSSDTANPIVTSGTFSLSLGADLAGLTSLGQGIGLASRTSSSGAWSAVQLTGANQNIVISSPPYTSNIQFNLGQDLGKYGSPLKSIRLSNLSFGTVNSESPTTIRSIGSGQNLYLSTEDTNAMVVSTSNLQIPSNKYLIFQEKSGNDTISLYADTAPNGGYLMAFPGTEPVLGQVLSVGSNVGNNYALDWASVPTAISSNQNTIPFFANSGGGLASTTIISETDTTANDSLKITMGHLTFYNNTGTQFLKIGGGSSLTTIEALSGNLILQGQSGAPIQLLGTPVQIGSFLQLSANTSPVNYYTGLQASSSMIGNYTLVFPPTVGTANQVLGNSGTPGTLAWQTITGGTVTSISNGDTVNNNLVFSTNPITSSGSIALNTTLSGISSIAATGNIIVSTGNITATAGSISAGTTITAGTGITATTGNIAASGGNVTASGSITAGTGITAATGNIATSSGNVTASGSVSSGTIITAGTGLTVTSGDVNISSSGTINVSGGITIGQTAINNISTIQSPGSGGLTIQASAGNGLTFNTDGANNALILSGTSPYNATFNGNVTAAAFKGDNSTNFWIEMPASGTTPSGSYNISTIAHSSTGQYTLNFSNVFSSTNYTVLVTLKGATGYLTTTSYNTGNVTINTFDTTGTPTDIAFSAVGVGLGS